MLVPQTPALFCHVGVLEAICLSVHVIAILTESLSDDSFTSVAQAQNANFSTHVVHRRLNHATVSLPAVRAMVLARLDSHPPPRPPRKFAGPRAPRRPSPPSISSRRDTSTSCPGGRGRPAAWWWLQAPTCSDTNARPRQQALQQPGGARVTKAGAQGKIDPRSGHQPAVNVTRNLKASRCPLAPHGRA